MVVPNSNLRSTLKNWMPNRRIPGGLEPLIFNKPGADHHIQPLRLQLVRQGLQITGVVLAVPSICTAIS